ncbi:MAG: helix-hairpin-helix domain-containing protein [Gammaproteobacteria bacterium]
MSSLNNKNIADRLREIADLLEQQGANPFRSNAYRRAATTLDQLERPVTEIIEKQGIDGLTELPAIGSGIARSLYEYVKTGRMSRLESLKAGHDPIELFEQIPGIGPTLAHRLIEVLHIDTLEALEVAAHNGRLSQVPGFSDKKIELVQAWLDHVLGYRRPASRKQEPIPEPPVALLLQIDFLYRKKAEADELPKIAPKRFNPSGEAWLPIMHVTQKGWHFTALYSNTPRAHQLDKTHDWVVLFYYDDEHHEGQHTVVTETKGALQGKRVVRGREDECRNYFKTTDEAN